MTLRISRPSSVAKPLVSPLRLVLMGLFLFSLTGCNTFGNSKLVKQLRQENERLLVEYRAQRDRSQELQRQNSILEERVAETEKQLALSYQQGQGRLSRRNSFAPSQYGSGNSPFSQSNPPTSAPDQSGLRWEPR